MRKHFLDIKIIDYQESFKKNGIFYLILKFTIECKSWRGLWIDEDHQFFK